MEAGLKDAQMSRVLRLYIHTRKLVTAQDSVTSWAETVKLAFRTENVDEFLTQALIPSES